MRRMDLSVFVQAVENRKRSVGITDEMIAGARNSGERRTAEKREMLACIQERARNSGLEPIPANY